MPRTKPSPAPTRRRAPAKPAPVPTPVSRRPPVVKKAPAPVAATKRGRAPVALPAVKPRAKRKEPAPAPEVKPEAPRFKPFTRFRNIRVTNDGYQVVIVRERVERSKLFAGHTKKSLRLAEEYRDQLLKEMPAKRQNTIPPKVLAALGLKEPVVGVFRHPSKQSYAVGFLDEERRVSSRSFSFRDTEDEAAVYKQAIKFRKQTIKAWPTKA